MRRDDPASATEIVDTFHMATLHALNCGDLRAARSAAELAGADDLTGDHPYLSPGKLVAPLALLGEFDEAIGHAEAMWDGWARAGRPPAKVLSPWAAAAALARGLRGDQAGSRLWLARAAELAGVTDLAESPRGAPFAAFVEARLAVHNGQLDDARRLVARAFADCPVGSLETYARAAGAELAIVAGLPDAAQLLASAEPAAAENDWAAACRARARGRLHHDAATLTEAADRWDRLGAVHERDATRALLT